MIKTFQDAVAATPDIASGYCIGLQALGANSAKITAPNMRSFGGSVDIDGCTRHLCTLKSRVGTTLSITTERYFT